MTVEEERDAKREAYEQLLHEFGGNVTTWSDFYNIIHIRMKQFLDCRCSGHAMEALYPLYSFMLALEALPEEGDIKKVVERMAQIMAYESKERLGAEMVSLSAQDMQTAAKVFNAMGGIPPQQAAAEVLGETEPTPAPVKRHLH